MGTDYFLKHSQNTLILCYVEQLCFPNKLGLITKPAEQGLDRVSLVTEQGALVSLSVTSSLSLLSGASENSPGLL